MTKNLDSLIAEVDEDSVAQSSLDGKIERIHRVVNLIDEYSQEGTRVLSLGSGFGQFEAIVSNLGYDVTAIDDLKNGDRSMEERKYLASKISDFCERHGAEFYLDDAVEPSAESIGKRDFDVVITLDVIEHIHQPREFLQTVRDVLKPEGCLIVLTPNGADLARRVRVLSGQGNGVPVEKINRPGPFRSHIKEYTGAELRELLQLNGFRPIETQFFNQSAQKTLASTNSLRMELIIRLYTAVTQFHRTLKDTQIVVAKTPESSRSER